MSTVEKDPKKGINAALAATLNGERAAAGMTFDALSDATGISKRSLLRYLSTMERDLSIPDAATIAAQFELTLVEAMSMAEDRMTRTRKGEERSHGS